MTIIEIRLVLNDLFTLQETEKIERYISQKCDGSFRSLNVIDYKDQLCGISKDGSYISSHSGSVCILEYAFRSKNLSEEDSEKKICDYLKNTFPSVVKATRKRRT